MKDKLIMIINIILGRPVMYRMTIHHPEQWRPLTRDRPNSAVRIDDHRYAVIVDCHFVPEGDAASNTKKPKP